MNIADKQEMVNDTKAYLQANGITPTRKNVLAQIEDEHGKVVAREATRSL
jgi:hypothetical protein